MVKGSATLVNLSEQLRVDSEAGFNKATAAMIANLDTQLVAFQEKVKQRPEEYRVVQTSSGSSRGGGMLDLLTLALLAVLGGGYLWLRRRG
jgi:rhombotail lipoprotein